MMVAMSEPVPAIATHGLRKTYGRGAITAVADLDLVVPAGGVHAFLGPNGSGKTTTLRMLLGLVRPDAGTMEILGTRVPEDLPDVVDRVGAIVEQPRLFPTMSGLTNLTIVAQAIGVPRRRVHEVLAQVGIASRARQDVRAYSLGMRQRLAIAATLLKDPDVLIFDEPTNGLDPAGIHEVRATMRQLGESGRTVLVSSHLLAEVQQIADTVSIIGRGRLLTQGRVADLLDGGGRVRVRIGEVTEAARVLTDAGYLVGLDGTDALTVGRPHATAEPDAVARSLGEAGLWPTELMRHAESLEDVFLRLTATEHLAVQPPGIALPRPETATGPGGAA